MLQTSRFMSHINNKKTVRMMGVPIHPWTMSETLDEISRRLDEGKFTQHVVVNVAKLVRSQNDSALRDSVVACDIINADGMGIVWGARFLGVNIPERVTGIDLFSNLLHLASERGDSVFLLGARPKVIEKTIKNIQADCPELQIAGWHHGYFWDNEKELVDIIPNYAAH
jgi:N-acetylglucosaminyldiphosphoundecaprenol N-acetyl-beta-D-mannosaminyltransferase